MITAFLDANVLYPPTLRSVLLELAHADLCAACWSDEVHREWMRALAEKRPTLDDALAAILGCVTDAVSLAPASRSLGAG